MRPLILVFILVLAGTMIIIPALFVTLFGHEVNNENTENVQLEINPSTNVPIKVYRSNSKTVEIYPLEEYVRGVVAAEMPINFELEALKAQAMAARTYIIKKVIDKDYSGVPQEAMVTDTVQHQVFKSTEELKEIWGLQYRERMNKLNRAINETSGQVITYQGKPITALFFSTSNGFTENSEDYYSKEVPYLKSVASPWDKASPKFEASKFVPFTSIKNLANMNIAVLTSTNQNYIQILELSDGNRVKKMKLGDKFYTGREVRELFGLNSSSFTFEITKEGIKFNTKGYGHGVGMSQYGADGMAKEGHGAEEIIKHYYTGVEITNIKEWIR